MIVPSVSLPLALAAGGSWGDAGLLQLSGSTAGGDTGTVQGSWAGDAGAGGDDGGLA